MPKVIGGFEDVLEAVGEVPAKIVDAGIETLTANKPTADPTKKQQNSNQTNPQGQAVQLAKEEVDKQRLLRKHREYFETLVNKLPETQKPTEKPVYYKNWEEMQEKEEKEKRKTAAAFQMPKGKPKGKFGAPMHPKASVERGQNVKTG